jgi:curved DNA-binding protein CbpA
MIPLSEQDHYEVLEVPRHTTADEIERAYRLARATYDEDSLAGYSILEEADAAAIRERIEAAYRVLSDADSRRAYDAALAAAQEPEAREECEPLREAGPPAPEPLSRGEALEAFAEEGGEVDGPRLRRARMRRGLDLDDLSRVTKVKRTYLECLEEERFSELPARVYVRGFVMGYASAIGLDPHAVAAGYMARYDRDGQQRRRRHGRGA